MNVYCFNLSVVIFFLNPGKWELFKKFSPTNLFFYWIEDSQTYAHADAYHNSDLAWPYILVYWSSDFLHKKHLHTSSITQLCKLQYRNKRKYTVRRVNALCKHLFKEVRLTTETVIIYPNLVL